jgi:hypothetical protein
MRLAQLSMHPSMADSATSSAMIWTARLPTCPEWERSWDVLHLLESAFISPTGWFRGIALLGNPEFCELHQLIRWNVGTPLTYPAASLQEEKMATKATTNRQPLPDHTRRGASGVRLLLRKTLPTPVQTPTNRKEMQ